LGAYFRQNRAIFLENNPGLVVWFGVVAGETKFSDENFRLFDSGCTVNLALAWNPPFRR
jgi:hypothetical protein